MAKLEHAWKERPRRRGLRGATGFAGNPSSSRSPLLRNEGRQAMERHGDHTVHPPAGQGPRLQIHSDVLFLRIREACMLEGGVSGEGFLVFSIHKR